MARKIIYVDNFLTAHGHTPTTGEVLTRLMEKEGYRVIRAGTKKSKPARLTEMLAAIVKNKHAVVLIATYSTSAFYFAWAASQLCRMMGIKYIPCLHGGNLPDRIKKHPRLSAQVFAHSYTNVVVSGYLQASIEKKGWRSLLIPNSIQLNAYPFLQRSSVRPRLLWVRSFHKIYNPGLAITLVAELSKIYPDASLTMVGPDKDGSLNECKRIADDLGVGSLINFTGRLQVAEWVKLSATHDIFVNTTNFDNLPVSVIEAMALGMPVISTDAGGIKYLITNNVNGYLVPRKSVSDFAERVEYLVNNPNTVASISDQARKGACQYSQEIVMQQWNALLNSIPR
jgi:glycosyltransferase involved in cell wall biosynthesis